MIANSEIEVCIFKEQIFKIFIVEDENTNQN